MYKENSCGQMKENIFVKSLSFYKKESKIQREQKINIIACIC